MVATEEGAAWRPVHHLCVLAALVVSLAFAFAKPSWCDEVAYVDPGAQLALTGRMFSTAWVTNSPLELWGSSNPGMPLFFAGWFKLIGFGQFQARLLFCLLHVGGVVFFFRWVMNRLAPHPWAIVLGVASSVLLPSLASSIFQCRLEVLAFPLAAWYLHYAWPNRRSIFTEWFAAPALGLAVVFFGLHFAGFFALVSALTYVLSPSWRTFRLGLGLAAGLILGMLVLWAAYMRLGIWDTFVAARACHYGRVLDWVPSGWKRFIAKSDLAMLAVLSLGGLAYSIFRPRPEVGSHRITWALSLAFFFAVPLFMGCVGIYYWNYSWMVAMPVMLCFYVAAPDLVGRARAVFIAIIVLGLGINMLRWAQQLPKVWEESARRQQVVQALGSVAPRGSSIAADFSLYYELVGAGYRFFPRVGIDEGLCLGFSQERFLPQQSKQAITCIVAKRPLAPEMIAGVGGEWRQSGIVPAPPAAPANEDFLIFIRK